MTPERWREIENLFLMIIDRPLAEQRILLDQACCGDQNLRRELESLLASDIRDQPLVEIPLFSTESLELDGNRDSDMAGMRIGPYRLARLIGHGGMGSVYLGFRDDDQYQKQVAIKLLNRGMDTDFMLSRFRQERQILANLEHPFIARMLDGGATEDGLPYFVMEFVDGVPITTYCASRNLSIVERLRLFRLVCEAVQHAHQNLVVHRDIKPGNILTTKEGVPKLLDFGIAKVLDPTVRDGFTLTRRELRMLTPDYASPEQVKGLPISTASDIYSLGVVLYELLTGKRPHHTASHSPADVERTICEIDPDKPSLAASRSVEGSPRFRRRRGQQLSGDLDNIVLMAIRKEPQRRYASAAELSEDIRRHIEGLPILAREDRWSYRAGKFIRRNRLGVGAALLVTVSLICGVVATTVQAQRAERRFQMVRGLANSILFDFHDSVQQLAGSTKVRVLMIETVLRYLDTLARDGAKDPNLNLEIAKAYHRIGTIEGHPTHPNLGRTAAARMHYQKALDMLRTLADQAEARSAAIEEMIAVNIEISDIELAAGNLEGAKSFVQNAAALVDSVQLSPNTETYLYSRLGDIEAQQGIAETAAIHYRKGLERALAWASESQRPEAYRALQKAYWRLANAARETGDLLACRDHLRKGQQIFDERLKQADRNFEDRRNLMSLYIDLAEIHGGPDDLNLGDHDAALANYRAAVALAEEFAAADQNDVRARRDLAIAYRRLGRMLSEEDPPEALKYFTKAMNIAEDLRTLDPVSIDFRRDVAEANLGIAILSRKSGRNDDAMRSLTRALELQKSIEGAAPYRVWLARYITQIYTEIGNVLVASGDAVDALNNYQSALEAAERLLMRAPTSLYLQRDRADVMEAIGKHYLTLAARRNLPPERRVQLKAEARAWLQKSLSVWQGWTNQKLAMPYADRRQRQATALLASIGQL